MLRKVIPSVSLWPILHLASGVRNIIAQRFEKSELFSPNNWCRDVTFEMPENETLDFSVVTV